MNQSIHIHDIKNVKIGKVEMSKLKDTDRIYYYRNIELKILDTFGNKGTINISLFSDEEQNLKDN